LVTTINICRQKCNRIVGSSEPKKTANHGVTKSDVCKFDINLWFCFALQLMGAEGEHAAILAAFLDLLEPHKWNRVFHVTKKFTHDAVEKVKEQSQTRSVEEEILATVSEEGNAVEQTMLELRPLVHRIQASYDMGWQVRSSGGRHASPTGHSMLIGALKKKVLDSIVYNKKCGTCMRRYSLFGNYDNVKTHKCVKNYE
jgi:hypothetical protein